MGVYIRGMEMPKNCMLCPFCVEEADPANGEMCMVTGTLMPPCTRERLDDCPLVPVPPHGRLIDENMLLCFLGENIIYDSYGRTIAKVPTVIPAEEGE